MSKPSDVDRAGPDASSEVSSEPAAPRCSPQVPAEVTLEEQRLRQLVKARVLKVAGGAHGLERGLPLLLHAQSPQDLRRAALFMQATASQVCRVAVELHAWANTLVGIAHVRAALEPPPRRP